MIKLTDEDHRIDYLVENGWKPSEARQWVQNHRPTFGESMYVLNRRFKELLDVIRGKK